LACLHFAFVGPADRPTTGKYVCANMSRATSKHGQMNG